MLPSKIVKILIPILFVLLAVLLLCRPLDQDNILFSGDIGFVFSVAEGIVNRLEVPLLGPSSHIGGRHLGAWYFYLVAFFYFITQKSVLLTVYCMIAVKVLALFIPLYLYSSLIISKKYDYIISVVAGFILILTCCNQQFAPLRMPWHGADLIIGSGILMTGIYYWVFRGQVGVFLLSSSLAFQLHFGFGPSVAAAAICGILIKPFCPLNNPSVLFNRICIVLTFFIWIPFVVFLIKYSALSPFASITSGHLHQETDFFKVLISNLHTLFAESVTLHRSYISRGWTLIATILLIVIAIKRSLIAQNLRIIATIICLCILPIIFTLILASILGQDLDSYIWFTSYSSIMILQALVCGLIFSCLSTRFLNNIFCSMLFLLLIKVVYFEWNHKYTNPYPIFNTIPGVKALVSVVQQQSGKSGYPFSIKGKDSIAGSESAGYFFLGPQYYPFHDTSNRFPELSSFRDRADKDTAKLLITDKLQFDQSYIRPWQRRGWKINQSEVVNVNIVSDATPEVNVVSLNLTTLAR